MNELLRAIYARPQDDQLRLVYADWLLERDDPLGEVIWREARGEDPAPLYAPLLPRLLGELYGHVFEPVFRLGFLHAAIDPGTGPVHSPAWRTVCSLDTERDELVLEIAHPALRLSTGEDTFAQLMLGQPLPLRRAWPVQLDGYALPPSAPGLPHLTHLALTEPTEGDVYQVADELLAILPLEVLRVESWRPPPSGALERWWARPTLQRLEWGGSVCTREGPLRVATLPPVASSRARARARQGAVPPELQRQAEGRWAAASARGLERPRNEDTFGAHPQGIWAVVDGMGGQGTGDWAAQLALRELVVPGTPAERFAAASRAILAVGPGLAAGVVRVRLLDGQVEVAWAGDVRAYLLHDGQLLQLTEEHSLVGEMVRRGRILPWQARVHEHANILVQAIPTQEVEPSQLTLTLQPGMRLLLVTDGVWRSLDDPTLHAMLLAHPEPQKLVEHMVREAHRCYGYDDATAMLVSVS